MALSKEQISDIKTKLAKLRLIMDDNVKYVVEFPHTDIVVTYTRKEVDGWIWDMQGGKRLPNLKVKMLAANYIWAGINKGTIKVL